MKQIIFLFLIWMSFGCNDAEIQYNDNRGVPPDLSYNNNADIDWIDTLTFYYRGIGYTSRYGYDYIINMLVFEDKSVNDAYWDMQTVQYLVKVINADGSISFYNATPFANYPIDKEGFMTFYFKGQMYVSRFWFNYQNELVFEDKEANDIYQRISKLPRFGVFIDAAGKMTFYEEPPIPFI